MKIVIIGDGKVGHKLAMQLSEENYDVTLIDNNEEKLKDTVNEMDVSCLAGDGADAEVQKEADVPGSDLVVACTSTDEMNMFCCLLARRLGASHTIARVRNPIYYREMHLIRDDLKLSMAVNPKLALASEIARVLTFPSADRIETFAHGRVELVELVFPDTERLQGLTIGKLYERTQVKILICAVVRDEEVYIPDGNFVLESGDKIYVAASHGEIEKFFRLTGNVRHRVKYVMLCGGGRVAYYLAMNLSSLGMEVKIIEKDRERCEQLCEFLPKVTIINGNATDHELLEEEGIARTDAFVSLTSMDEENIIMSLFARTHNVPKVVTKVNDEALQQMVEKLGFESVVSAKEETINQISRYVRAMSNSMGSVNVETVYELIDGAIEAVEFRIREATEYTGVQLKNLKFKKNYLVACIVRKRRIIIPRGDDTMEVDDSVIVVTKETGLDDLKDILQ